MERLPFDEFLRTLAAKDVYPDPADIQEADVEAIWQDVPSSARESFLRELGVASEEMGELSPRLEDTDVVFDELDPRSAEDEDHTAIPEAANVQDRLGAPAVPGAAPTDEPGAVDVRRPEPLIGPLAPEPWTLGQQPVDPAIEAAEAFSQLGPAQIHWLEEGQGPDADPIGPELFAWLEEGPPAEQPPEPSQGPAPVQEAGAALEEPALSHEPSSQAEAEAGEDPFQQPVDPAQAELVGEFDGDHAETIVSEELDELEIEELEDDAVEELVEDEKEDDARREVEVYPVYEPYGYVRILYDDDDHQYLYEVIEPELTEREQTVLDFIQETIVDVIEVGLSRLTEEEAEEMLVDLTNEIIEDYSIEVDEKTRMRLTYYIVRDFLGFGKLDVIMRDPMIEDVSCDGVEIPIFLYHRKYESMASTVSFEEEDLDSFVIKLAQRSGKHISVADPLLDARLPDGSRLNATLSDEVTTSGSTFTIRKFRDEPFTPTDLIRFGTLDPKMLAYYWLAIQHGASMIVAGGTASGKTTMLNAVMLFIPPQMKIVSIEDTRELNLPHPNWIPGTTRSGFGPRDETGRQAGEINMFELLKAALRQRPEYITVGEVRGEEATVLFQAMATGHAAYGTMHADSVTSVIHRLEGEPINIPRPLLEALDIVTIQIQTRIGGQRVRRTQSITEVVGMDPNTKELLTNEVFEWRPGDDTFDHSGISYVLERIQKENNMTDAELQQEVENRTLLIEWMKEHGVRDYVEVGTVVQSYYNEPEDTVHKIRVDMGLEEPEEGREYDLEDDLLDDREIKGAGEKGEEFDPSADIPVPEDASLVSPLEEEELAQIESMEDGFDPVEATQEPDPLEEADDEQPAEVEAALVDDLGEEATEAIGEEDDRTQAATGQPAHEQAQAEAGEQDGPEPEGAGIPEGPDTIEDILAEDPELPDPEEESGPERLDADPGDRPEASQVAQEESGPGSADPFGAETEGSILDEEALAGDEASQASPGDESPGPDGVDPLASEPAGEASPAPEENAEEGVSEEGEPVPRPDMSGHAPDTGEEEELFGDEITDNGGPLDEASDVETETDADPGEGLLDEPSLESQAGGEDSEDSQQPAPGQTDADPADVLEEDSAADADEEEGEETEQETLSDAEVEETAEERVEEDEPDAEEDTDEED